MVVLGSALCGVALAGGGRSGGGASEVTRAEVSAVGTAHGESTGGGLGFTEFLASVHALGRGGLQEGWPDQGAARSEIGTTVSAARREGEGPSGNPEATASQEDLSLLVLGGLGLAGLLVMGRRNSGSETEGDCAWLLTELSAWGGVFGDTKCSQYSALRDKRGLHPKTPTA